MEQYEHNTDAAGMVERVVHGGKEYAVIIRAEYERDGIEFFTPDHYSQQLAYMRRPEGYVIEAHEHNPVPREVAYTREVLLIRSGRLRIDLYDEERAYIESRVVCAGDVVLLTRGGHGFEMLEESEIIEIKQGPYPGVEDKTRFAGIAPCDACVKGCKK